MEFDLEHPFTVKEFQDFYELLKRVDALEKSHLDIAYKHELPCKEKDGARKFGKLKLSVLEGLFYDQDHLTRWGPDSPSPGPWWQYVRSYKDELVANLDRAEYAAREYDILRETRRQEEIAQAQKAQEAAQEAKRAKYREVLLGKWAKLPGSITVESVANWWEAQRQRESEVAGDEHAGR